MAISHGASRRKSERENLRRTRRALGLLTRCNAALREAVDEQALLEQICRIAVDSAGYRMAWVGYAEQDELKTVRPVAYAGPGKGFLDQILVSWGDNPHGHGTAGSSIRSGKPEVAKDLLHHPAFAPWHDAFLTRDFEAAVGLPLSAGALTYGALIIYAAETEAFDDDEVALLEELGRNLAYGILSLRSRKESALLYQQIQKYSAELERRVAERTAELEQEIAERVQIEQSLRSSEAKYRELVEHANSIILRMDTKGCITFFNEFAERFFGYEAREILGQSVVGTIVPETESSGRDLAALMVDLSRHPDVHTRSENENMRRNGERVWISWTNRPRLDSEGRLIGSLCIGNDITELKAAEAELLRAKEAAESADRIKSAFLATMSHELRTPLNSIIGFTGILLQGLSGPLSDKQRKQLTMVQSSGRHLLALINDVLDISKIEAGQMTVGREPFDLRASIQTVTQSMQPLAQKKNLSLETDIAPQVGWITSDQRRVEQILMNLLSNAIKFTDHGGVGVRGRVEEDWVSIAVSDTGMGIPPDQVQDIFRPFLQLDTGLARRHEGTGLGLSICARLLELMGGQIGVESRPGYGSTFTFKLPCRREGSHE